MKKSIIIILCVSIGVVAVILFPKRAEHPATIEEPPMAQINLASHIEDNLRWEDVGKLLRTLGQVGCVDYNINGFYWNCYPLQVRTYLPRDAELDEVILPYIFEDPSPRVSPDPSKQYDLNIIKAWCRRNQGKHSQIRFGPDVRFNAVREITDIFHNHKMTFGLYPPHVEGDNKSVVIRLNGRTTDEKTKSAQPEIGAYPENAR